MKRFLLVILLVLMALPAYALEGPEIDFGGAVRLRGYSMENFWDFNDQADVDNWSVFRLYTTINAKADLGDNVFAYVQLSNQNFSEGVTDVALDKWEKDNESNKVFVDNAFIDVNKSFNLPMNLRVGRQNLMYGTGFVLFDGQSQYASTSLYLDGVKLTWDITDNAKIDFLYFKDQEYNRADFADDDITLSGAYFTGKCPVVGGQQEIYILNRKDDGFDFTGGGPLVAGAGKKDIWMYGLRLSDKFPVGLDYSAEIAYQDGHLRSSDLEQDALGYKLDLGYAFDAPLTPRIFAGYTYMSGDDDFADGESNAWDVFYGGWPQFGDLLAWVFVNAPPNTAAAPVAGSNDVASVGGEAAYTNLLLPKVGVSMVAGDLSAELSYTMIMIDEPIGVASHDFGDYYQLGTKYAYNKYLSFGTYAAVIDPGEAFSGPADDTVYELFWETQVKF